MQYSNNKSASHALNEKPGFHVWWRLLRPHTLTASFIPVFVGTMLASIEQSIHIPLFLAMLVASMLIQSATNMFNEYYDFVRGLDNEDSIGIGGTIVRDGIPAKVVLSLAITFFVLAMLLGVYICSESSWWIALIGLVSMLFGYLYTGGPYPIAYSPFGELFAGFFMGTIIIGISFFIQTGQITNQALLVSVPVAILIGTILLSNNIRDLEGDRENGRKTIAILVGHKRAVQLLGVLFTASFLLTVIYVLVGLLPLWSVLVLLSLKKAREAVISFVGKSTNLEMMPGMKATAQTNTAFGFLLGVSLLLHTFIPFSL